VDLEGLLKQIDAAAARHVIDAMLIEGERVKETQTPEPRDYEQATLGRGAPAGGWLSHEELRDTSRRMAEAIAVENWTAGLICAVKLLSVMGGAL
jgi:hypothetical protein